MHLNILMDFILIKNMIGVFMDYKEKLEIDIINLLKTVMKKWKIMLVCAVIISILAGIYGYVKSATEVNAETGVPVATTDENDLQTLKDALTEADAQIVENAVLKYIDYTYQLEVEYAELDIDPDNVYTYVMTYAIVDDSIEINTEENAVFLSKVNNIITVYSSQLTNESVVNEVIKELNLDLDPETIKSMISIWKGGGSLLYLSVVSESKSNTKKIMSIMQERMDNATEDIQKLYSYSLVPVTSYFSVSTSNYISNLQKEYTDNRTNISNSIAALTNSMSEQQKSYYNALIVIANEAKEEIGIANFSENNLNTIDGLFAWDKTSQSIINTKIVHSIDKKFILLGFAGGFFVAFMCYALLYILSGKLHTSDDLKNAFELNVIGETNSSNTELITSGIELLASKGNYNKLCIIGASKNTNSYRQTLKQYLNIHNNISTVENANDIISKQPI